MTLKKDHKEGGKPAPGKAGKQVDLDKATRKAQKHARYREVATNILNDIAYVKNDSNKSWRELMSGPETPLMKDRRELAKWLYAGEVTRAHLVMLANKINGTDNRNITQPEFVIIQLLKFLHEEGYMIQTASFNDDGVMETPPYHIEDAHDHE